jgi:sugar phosphate isomerase/epimerase
MSMTRRELLAATPLAVGAAMVNDRPAQESFDYCLNSSTIRGQNLDIVQIVEIAAKAGYKAIEPWISDLESYVKKGGDLGSLRQRISDHGLTVESAIGFAEWVVDDEGRRKKGLETARRDMDFVKQIGGIRLAAPPAGVRREHISLERVTERYRALLDLGDQMGVVPEMEFWGPSPVVSRLGQAAQIAIDSGHPKACILADVFHLYKGGSALEGLRLLNGNAMHVLHFNDYPALPRNSITDAERVYPGDGVAPLKAILQDLKAIGFQGFLSLELFNRDYWKQDALTVARTGLDRMRSVVQMLR